MSEKSIIAIKNFLIETLNLSEYFKKTDVDKKLVKVSALTGWRSLRRCPTCQMDLLTNGLGDYQCDCGYRDHKDIQRFLDQGYDYPIPPGLQDSKFEGNNTESDFGRIY